MTDYGVTPQGYKVKPMAVILAELEAKMMQLFGPGVIQTSESPLGQLNGFVADVISEIEDRNLGLYQSNDPDQAEGVNLDRVARFGLIRRDGREDDEFRKLITGEGSVRPDLIDIEREIDDLPGVTFVRAFDSNSGDTSPTILSPGMLAVAVIGGIDGDIAKVLRDRVAPGVRTFGNHQVEEFVNDRCRSFNIIRPIIVTVDAAISLRIRKATGCPAPSTSDIIDAVENGWSSTYVNGDDVSFPSIRRLIEGDFFGVEILSVTLTRDGEVYDPNAPVPIGFIEMASINVTSVTVAA